MTLRDLLGRVAGPPKPQPGGLSTDRRHVIRELDLPPADARIHLVASVSVVDQRRLRWTSGSRLGPGRTGARSARAERKRPVTLPLPSFVQRRSPPGPCDQRCPTSSLSGRGSLLYFWTPMAGISRPAILSREHVVQRRVRVWLALPACTHGRLRRRLVRTGPARARARSPAPSAGARSGALGRATGRARRRRSRAASRASTRR
jgi:hypothetical protein